MNGRCVVKVENGPTPVFRARSLVITIDTKIKAKRNNMISKLITFRTTKAKAKGKFGVKYLCGHECERSSVQFISIRTRKCFFVWGINFTLISVSTAQFEARCSLIFRIGAFMT